MTRLKVYIEDQALPFGGELKSALPRPPALLSNLVGKEIDAALITGQIQGVIEAFEQAFATSGGSKSVLTLDTVKFNIVFNVSGEAGVLGFGKAGGGASTGIEVTLKRAD